MGIGTEKSHQTRRDRWGGNQIPILTHFKMTGACRRLNNYDRESK